MALYTYQKYAKRMIFLNLHVPDQIPLYIMYLYLSIPILIAGLICIYWKITKWSIKFKFFCLEHIVNILGL